MATYLDRDATADEYLALVRCWVTLLAEDRYEEAYDLTEHDPYYEWTPTLIAQLIDGYGIQKAIDYSRSDQWSTCSTPSGS